MYTELIKHNNNNTIMTLYCSNCRYRYSFCTCRSNLSKPVSKAFQLITTFYIKYSFQAEMWPPIFLSEEDYQKCFNTFLEQTILFSGFISAV